MGKTLQFYSVFSFLLLLVLFQYLSETACYGKPNAGSRFLQVLTMTGLIALDNTQYMNLLEYSLYSCH